jgi:hypothetical protein
MHVFEIKEDEIALGRYFFKIICNYVLSYFHIIRTSMHAENAK